MKLPSDNNKQVAGGKTSFGEKKCMLKSSAPRAIQMIFLRPLQIERRCMSGRSLFVVYFKKSLKKQERQKSLNKSWEAARGRWIENAGLNDGLS